MQTIEAAQEEAPREEEEEEGQKDGEFEKEENL
jgi:hypothetical protein